MAWQTPKTDWACRYDTDGNYTGDYFNATDYQRIKGNLEYLAEAAESMQIPATLPSIPDITTASFGTAASINAVEQSLDALITAGVYGGWLDARKTWYGNGTPPLAADLNRIENSCLLLKRALESQDALRARLPVVLGKEQF